MRSEDPNPALSPVQFLARLQCGQLLHDLKGAVATVTAGVKATGRPGEINIKISFAAVNNAPDAVNITTKVTEKVPRPNPPNDLLFVGEGGALHENNPRQRDIFGPRPVPSNVDPETGEIVNQRAG